MFESVEAGGGELSRSRHGKSFRLEGKNSRSQEFKNEKDPATRGGAKETRLAVRVKKKRAGLPYGETHK
jgi:hypothetical protein